MARKIDYRKNITKLYKKGKYKEFSESDAEREVNNILDKYSIRTKRTVLKQHAELGVSYQDTYAFLKATENYNRNRQMRYNKAIKDIVKPQWENYVNKQSNAWRNEIYDNKGNLTETGKDVYSRFTDDTLSDLVPKKDKSFILSDSQMKTISFDKTLLNRMEMGTAGYITDRQQRYFDNYEKALRKTHENADEYIKKYRELSTNEKIKFSYEAQGYIRYQYTQKDDSQMFNEFCEAIDHIKNS